MERLTDKRMKGDGFVPVDPKEYKAFVRNEKPTGKQIYQRLLEAVCDFRRTTLSWKAICT